MGACVEKTIVQKPISREEAKAIIAEIDARVREHCPAGMVNSVTRTDMPDGEGGFLTASRYAGKLLRERISEQFPGGLGEKCLEILRLGPNEGKHIVVELGTENFNVLRESFAALDAEAGALDSSHTPRTELMHTSTSGMVTALSGALYEARTVLGVLAEVREGQARTPSTEAISAEEAKRIVVEIDAKVKEHYSKGRSGSVAETDVRDEEGRPLSAQKYAANLLIPKIAELFVDSGRQEGIGNALRALYADRLEDMQFSAEEVRRIRAALDAIKSEADKLGTDAVSNGAVALQYGLIGLEERKKYGEPK